jgi:MFS family permease
MVALGFVSQGVAYGMTFGMAGTFIGPAGEEFGASRTALSLGPSLVALLHGLLGPLVGLWIVRGSVRNVMTAGALFMGSAFLLMHFATNEWVFALSLGLLGGAAVACLGITPVIALVGRWFHERAGRAIGIANMPVLITLLPPAAAYVNVHFGWRTTALASALLAFALVPLFRLVREAPPRVLPLESAAPQPPPDFGAAQGFSLGRGFRPDRLYWLLTIAVGIFESAGILITTHIIPYATESGVGYQRATLLVSIMGICGIFGVPTLGILADRIGAPRTLMYLTLVAVGAWSIFLAGASFAGLAAGMAMQGFAGAAFAALVGIALAERYPRELLGPAVGLSVLVALPFNFLLPLLAGAVHDLTGSYRLAFAGQIALFVLAGGMLAIVVRAIRAGRWRSAAHSEGAVGAPGDGRVHMS